MAEHQQTQMTLDVGSNGDEVIVGTYGISGALGALSELKKGDEVRVVITDADGELVSTSLGIVSTVAFKDHRKGNTVVFTERKHTVKLAA